MLNRARQKRDIEKNKVPNRQLVTHTHKHLKCICWIEVDRNGTKKKILSLGFHASFLPLDRNDDSRKNIVPRQKFLFTLTHDLLAPPTLRFFPLRSKKLRWLAISMNKKKCLYNFIIVSFPPNIQRDYYLVYHQSCSSSLTEKIFSPKI